MHRSPETIKGDRKYDKWFQGSLQSCGVHSHLYRCQRPWILLTRQICQTRSTIIFNRTNSCDKRSLTELIIAMAMYGKILWSGAVVQRPSSCCTVAGSRHSWQCTIRRLLLYWHIDREKRLGRRNRCLHEIPREHSPDHDNIDLSITVTTRRDGCG